MLKMSIPVAFVALVSSSTAWAQTEISPQGYSGGAMTPSADVIGYGFGAIAFDRQLPGAAAPKGFNYQTGWGLFPGLEIVGRLATQDIDCNMFRRGECPPDIIRDFSASVKYALPLPWDQSGPRVALGVTDLGGAATYFRSGYWVASQRLGPFDLSLGMAQKKVSTAPLDGKFFSLKTQVAEAIALQIEQSNGGSWASVSYGAPVPFTRNSKIALRYTKRVDDTPLTTASWLGLSLSIPIDINGVSDGQRAKSALERKKYIVAAKPEQLQQRLSQAGFYSPQVLRDGVSTHISVENQSYAWNAIDAFAEALAAAVAADYNDGEREIVIQVTQRGIPLASLRGSVACAKEWLERAFECEDTAGRLRFESKVSDVPTKWMDWRNLRPELVVSPLISSLIGSEAGAFDYDLAWNANLTLSLYRGGVIELNRQFPAKANTDDFDKGGPFYSARFRTATTRKLFHHYHHIPQLQTHIKASLGTINTVWDGWQLETYSASQSGAHRLSISTGRFENEALKGPSAVRTPQLLSYRYMPSAWPVVDSELTLGEFWGGDSGYLFTQRFWFGDTTLSAYLRRSKMPNQADYVSFFGFRVTVPLTPRVLRTGPFVGIRGTSQFNYAAETKVFEKDNKITPGYGVIPNVGEPLAVTLNRDRMGTAYLNANRYRLHSAFQE